MAALLRSKLEEAPAVGLRLVAPGELNARCPSVPNFFEAAKSGILILLLGLLDAVALPQRLGTWERHVVEAGQAVLALVFVRWR
jgi:hypothetical protein